MSQINIQMQKHILTKKYKFVKKLDPKFSEKLFVHSLSLFFFTFLTFFFRFTKTMKKKLPFGLPDGNFVGGDVDVSFIEKIPFSGDFNSYEDYEISVKNWKEKISEAQLSFLFPIPASFSVSKCPRPVIQKEIIAKLGNNFAAKSTYLHMLEEGLCPENEQEIENIVIHGLNFDETTPLPKIYSKKQSQTVMNKMTKEMPKLKKLVQHQPIPYLYDTYEEYYEQMKQWSSHMNELNDIYDFSAFSNILETVTEKTEHNLNENQINSSNQLNYKQINHNKQDSKDNLIEDLKINENNNTNNIYHKESHIIDENENKQDVKSDKFSFNRFNSLKISSDSKLSDLMQSLYQSYKKTLLNINYDFHPPPIDQTLVILKDENIQAPQSFLDNMIEYGEFVGINYKEPDSKSNFILFKQLKQFNSLQRHYEYFQSLNNLKYAQLKKHVNNNNNNNTDKDSIEGKVKVSNQKKISKVKAFFTKKTSSKVNEEVMQYAPFSNPYEDLVDFSKRIEENLSENEFKEHVKVMLKLMRSTNIQINMLWAKIYIFFHYFIKKQYQMFGTFGDVLNLAYSTTKLFYLFSTTSYCYNVSKPQLINENDTLFQQFQTATLNMRYLEGIHHHFLKLGKEYSETTQYFNQFMKDFYQVFEGCLDFMQKYVYDFLEKTEKNEIVALFLFDFMKIKSTKVSKFIQNIPNTIFSFFEKDEILLKFREGLLLDRHVSSIMYESLLRMPKKFIPRFIAGPSNMLRSFIAELFASLHPLLPDLKPFFVSDFLSPIATHFCNCEVIPYSVSHFINNVVKLYVDCIKSKNLYITFEPFFEQNILFFLALIRQKDCLLSVSLKIMAKLIPIAITNGSMTEHEILSVIEPITLHMCCAENSVSSPAWKCMRRILKSAPNLIIQIANNQELVESLILAISGIHERNYVELMSIINLYGSTIEGIDNKKSKPSWKVFAELMKKSQFNFNFFSQNVHNLEKFVNSRRYSKELKNMLSTFKKNPAFLDACQSAQ